MRRWHRWFPWRYMVRRIARAQGFVDPFAALGAINRFGLPAEVAQPTELLRAGVIMHARGLVNTQAIQHNLDWVWPLWVERQFDPDDAAFIPRAFSITHINLTHRNWTAVGVLGAEEMPLVDPHGLVTPHFDGWSLDFWIVSPTGAALYPSKLKTVLQKLEFEDPPAISTSSSEGQLNLTSHVSAIGEQSATTCRVVLSAFSDVPADLIVSVRPYNPEGISFVHNIATSEDEITINGTDRIHFGKRPDHLAFSNYAGGDVALHLGKHERVPVTKPQRVHCDVGLATVAALYQLEPKLRRSLTIDIPLTRRSKTPSPRMKQYSAEAPAITWKSARREAATVVFSNKQYQFLYDASLYTLLLLSPNDIYPGSFTYKRFWFRDAAFMLHALLCCGVTKQVERVIDRFFTRQMRSGYFLSQEGEWDSNGEALWIIARYVSFTGTSPKREWIPAIIRAADWIIAKRHSHEPDPPLTGLLPAGFSAEHFGPTDYYYWDDYWGVAGLKAAAELLAPVDGNNSTRFAQEASEFTQDIERSIALVIGKSADGAIPASARRRMDAGAIGNIVASYPLQLYSEDDPRMSATVNFLLGHCMHNGGFFQDVIHSGMNPYLTLHLAQALMRNRDTRFSELARSVAQLASPTGQWPEAIHPKTHGGCMGDGQHGWAAAEWVMFIRNSFVREERDRLILCSGLTEELLAPGEPLSFGPTLTPYGTISVIVEIYASELRVRWEATWRSAAPTIEVALPGRKPIVAEAGRSLIVQTR